MAQVKGTALVSSFRYLRERFGDEAPERVLAALSEEERQAIGPNPLVSSWYPMPAFVSFMREVESLFGDAEPEVARKMGRASADYGLTTVYKIFFKVGSPEFIIGKATGVFSSYYDTGRLDSIESSQGYALFDLVDFEGARPVCQRIRGWIERTLELAGAKDVTLAHTECLHEGGTRCRFEGNWDS